jgi:HEAT repeat protein
LKIARKNEHTFHLKSLNVEDQYLKLKIALAENNLDEAIAAVRSIVDSSAKPPPLLGKELGIVIKDVYDHLCVVSVHAFYTTMEQHLSPAIFDGIHEILKQPVELTIYWANKMDVVYRERLARELREKIKGKDYNGAIRRIQKLFQGARTPEDTQHTIEYVGNNLGSLENDQPTVNHVLEQLLRSPDQYGFDEQTLRNLESSKTQRLQTIFRMRVENREIEWNRALVEATVELRGHLPRPTLISEPAPEETENFAEVIKAILRIPFYRNSVEHVYDVLILLVEFCPREISIASARSGIEPRVHATLGPRAQYVVNNVFSRICSETSFCEFFLKFTKRIQETHYLRMAIELMGAFRSEVFFDFLMECQEDKKLLPIRGEVIDALGRIGNEKATLALLTTLRDVLKGRIIDPPKMREASRVINALGHLTKSKRLNPNERNVIINQTIELIPPQELPLRLEASLTLFDYQPAALDQGALEWAAESLVQGLWMSSLQPEFAQGDDRQATILGFREKIVNVLIRIGKAGLPKILEIADSNLAHYGGAYLALAEVLEKIRDERAVPLLEKMLLNAFIVDETKISKYRRDKYWDSAEGARREIPKDTITAALVHALNEIGGERAENFLVHVFRQIQSKHLPPPGKETASFLLEANMRISRAKGRSAFASPHDESTIAIEETPADRVVVERLLKSLKSWSLFSNLETRKRKIAAIQELTQRKSLEAIEPIAQALADKDKLVQNAAMTALLDYGSPESSKTVFDTLFYILLDLLRNASKRHRDQLEDVFIRLAISNPQCLPRLHQVIAQESNPTLRARASTILMRIERERKFVKAVEDSSWQVEIDDSKEPRLSMKPVTEVERRRQYYVERQKWVRGGKKGPPPERPLE